MERNLLVKPGDRFDYWHEVTCRKYSRTECLRRPVTDFRAMVASQEFGFVSLNEISSSTDPDHSIGVVRTPADIRRDSRDDFFIWFALGGSTVVEQEGRTASLQPGDLVLHDQSRPFALEFGAWSHAAMAAVPRALLARRVGSPEKLVGRRIGRDTRLGALAGSVFRELLDLEGDIAPPTAARLGSAALDIWATTIESELTDTSQQAPARQRRLEEVKQHMLANLGDSNLGLEDIAKSQNMSASTLVRLFASEGVTPIRWLWQQRLAASYSALVEGRVRYVSGAAMEFGFVDASRFNRVFKAEFGRTPGEVLRGSSKTA